MSVCVLSICFWYELFIWLQVKNELPSTFKAYRYQQHRWSCGPANLFRKMAMEIINNKVSLFCFLELSFIRNMQEQDKLCWLLMIQIHVYVMSIAESVIVEEDTCDLQLLLCSEGRSTHQHVCVLLHCITCNSFGAWGCGPKVGSCLYPFHHHYSKCSWNSKVLISNHMNQF